MRIRRWTGLAVMLLLPAVMGCEAFQRVPIGPVAVEIDVGVLALSKDAGGWGFELGDTLVAAIPLCDVVSPVDIEDILRQHAEASFSDRATLTEVILTSMTLHLVEGDLDDASSIGIYYLPQIVDIADIGNVRRIGSAGLGDAADGAVYIVPDGEIDLLPLADVLGDAGEGACPSILVRLTPTPSVETVAFHVVLNADAYGEVSISLGDAAELL